MRKVLFMLFIYCIFTANLFADWDPAKLLPGEETIALQSKDKLNLGGSVYYPVGYSKDSPSDKKYPAVILIHSWLRDRSDWTPFIPALQQAGYVVIAIDLRNHGVSENKRYWHLATYHHLSRMLYDARAAYDYILQKDFVDKTKIYAGGVSIGAIIATKLCSEINGNRRLPHLKGVILVSPSENYFGVSIETTIEYCTATPFLFVVDKTDPRPNDNNIYISGMKIYKIFRGPKDKIEFDGTGHGNKMIATDRFTDEALAWIKAH